MKLSTANVTERGGMFVGMPDDINKSFMLSDSDLDYYVENYKRSGFRGGLNWYRNVEANWRWNFKIADKVKFYL